MKDQKRYKVLGLMSGTSLDGLDLCLVEFHKNENGWGFSILDASTISYSKKWEKQLKKAHKLSSKELITLDVVYGKWIAKKALRFLGERAVDLIASHGHTVYHQPEKGLTLQVGNGAVLSEETRQVVVSDFRTQDVLMGGQGAPLVPIGDRDLFSQYSSCLNLGGFANASFEEKGKRVAFDICAVNFVMNRLAKKNGLPYDEGGKLAQRGKVDNALFEALNALPFFSDQRPKSLGREWVKAKVRPLIKQSKALSVEDRLATFCEHIGYQIGIALEDQTEVLVTGGGAFNTFLMERIRHYLPQTDVVIPSEEVIDNKEALVFAYLGLLRMKNEVNILSSVTGSSRDHSSGKMDYPRS